ncbi:TOBE domain-containing protein [Derxia gummosa]|uniref:TOBE domain-containing protein n=1 Tax=Derxia gummosa DSM 723 TaxID=1121388 RepID=A0A8B6X6J9_9BURK|nr:TOBE domain-containing protein [Derxia gummosa]
MAISARNAFEGSITSVTPGAVNSELVITTPSGVDIVATVTVASVEALGLAVGRKAVAIVKAPSVIVVAGRPGYRFSARNQLRGKVARISAGAVNSEVGIDVGGVLVQAVITNQAVVDLGLGIGADATAIFKAGSVIVGVAD